MLVFNSAYASNAELLPLEERVARVVQLRDAGLRAVKIRFHQPDWRDDVAVVEAVRNAVGPGIEIMVDANQGWRMPGDLEPRWDVATAAQCARALEPAGVYWLEEPLPTEDVDGYAALRARTDVRLAAGEMVRSFHEARDLVLRGGIDVIQTDVVLAGGFTGCRRVAALAGLCGRTWSPHTWSNGYGLLVNLHAALGLSSCPYVEVPLDPPTLDAARRDWLLPAPVAKWLELSAAVRYDHYSDFGNSTTPKLGFKVKPIDQVAIRGTYSEAFRAPGPAERGGPIQEGGA